MTAIEHYIREDLRNIRPYSSARDEFTGPANAWLDANENSLVTDYNRYPDPLQKQLKQVIAKLKGVKEEHLFLGNGSDEVLDLILRLTCMPYRNCIAFPVPSYGMYGVLAALNGLKTVCLPLNKDFTSRLYEQLYEIIECKLLIICNPNNPTGTIIPLEELQKILREFTGIVVIDEAYSDFCPDVSAAHLVNEFPNLIVVQTLSKAYGMAGLRVGMAIASNDWIRALNSIKPPYNISSLVQETAIGLLESTDWSAVKQQLLSERERLFTFLKGHPQVTQVIESAANFILFRVKDAAGLYALLLKNGVIVRNRSNDYNCENCLRITIGTRSENDLFISILNTCNYD